LNKYVAEHDDPHDPLIELIDLGDASSIPALIQALGKMGDVPREGPYGSVCTRAHCLEALRTITNQDAGRNASDWQQWLNENRDKPRERWIRWAGSS
jgi:hypothetical protein